MTATPTSSLAIATDATVTAGPEVGLAVRADPGSGQLAQGPISGAKYPARWLNWIFGTLADWCSYLREAMPVRLSSTPRVFLIPIERTVDVTDGTPPAEAPTTTSEITGANTLFGSGNHYQPVLAQRGSNRQFVIDLSDILPKDGLLTKIQLQVMGDGAWGAALPTSLPLLVLQYVASAGGLDLDPVVVTTIASQVDLSSTAGQFQLKHYITLTPGAPLDLATAGTAHQVRVYLAIAGAVDASMAPVYFFNARAEVTSKTWV
jgi:hypothetical protein